MVSRRLTRLLREMSAGTQFVIITHSKKTMESAQAMYGVTMQAPGVSRLVSVKFDALAVSVAGDAGSVGTPDFTGATPFVLNSDGLALARREVVETVR